MINEGDKEAGKSYCILCGKPSLNGKEVCGKCKIDYQIPDEKCNKDYKKYEIEKEKDDLRKRKENQEGTIAIIFSFLFPLIGLIFGIVFCCKNDDKSKPILAIIISILFIWLIWYFFKWNIEIEFSILK